MPEDIGNSLADFQDFCKRILSEPEYHELMECSAEARCRWLLEQCNRRIILRDKDWQKILNDIKTYEYSFKRYYPAARVDCTSDEITYMVQAYMINDDLYEFKPEVK
jgi:hypothetical protein